LKISILAPIVNVVTVLNFTFSPAVLAVDDSDFLELRSSHFVIRYQEEVSKDYVYKIKNVSEKFYRIITQEFNLIRDELWLWDNRAKVFIAKDRESYLSRFGCSSWSGACVNYLAKIIYTYPDQNRFNAIFIHELTHIILHEYLGRAQLPSWLDEGIAVYIEDKYGGQFYQGRIPGLKTAIKNNKHIPISDLLNLNPKGLHKKSSDYASLFYVESFSIVNFFIERYGKYNFSRFLSYLKRGEKINKAIERSFRDCRSIEELEKQWMKFYLK